METRGWKELISLYNKQAGCMKKAIKTFTALLFAVFAVSSNGDAHYQNLRFGHTGVEEGLSNKGGLINNYH